MPASVLPYSQEWRERYLASRYLQYQSVEGLVQRYEDLLRNVLTFDSRGEPQFDGLHQDTGWTRRIADLFAETDIRGLGEQWRAAVEQGVLARRYPRVLRAIEAWGGRKPEPGTFVVKYGRREHMAAFANEGVIRVALASTYADPTLNPAIRDDELSFCTHMPPGTELRIQTESGDYEPISNIAGSITHTRRCEDYYVFCTACNFDPRAFDDFDAAYDSCVLIHDWRAFSDAIKVCPAPARKLSASSAVYLDPFMPHRDCEVAFAKHLRYAYQREWRLIWENPVHEPPPRYFYFELGDVSSFCELITL